MAQQALPAYKRLTVQAERLIAGAYLAGTNTRRVRRALAALFGAAVGKDTVSRAWRKLQSDWEAWQKRDLAGHDIIRLILDGTVVRVRRGRKTTSLSVLVALREAGHLSALAWMIPQFGDAHEPLHDIDQLAVRGAARISELIGRVPVGQPAKPQQLAHPLSPI